MAFIGNQTNGGNPRSLNGAYRAYRITMPDNVDPGNYILHAKIEDTVVGDNFRGLIFGADLSTVVASTTVRSDISTAQFEPFSGGTFASVGLVASTVYYLAVGSDSAAGANAFFDDDADPPDNDDNGFTGTVNSLTADPPTITGSLVNDPTRPFCIYLEYTPAVAGGDRVLTRLGSGIFIPRRRSYI